MTKIGYQNIKDRINNLIVNIPKEMTPAELKYYFLGYENCLKSINNLLDTMEENEQCQV